MKRLLALAALAACLPLRAAQFTLVIHETPTEMAARTDAEKGPAYWSAWGDYARAMQEAGIVRGGMPLKAASEGAAKPVSPSVSGVFMIEVADAREAAAWAARAPRGARVDVREQFPAPAMR